MSNALLTLIRNIELNLQDVATDIEHLSLQDEGVVGWEYASTYETMFRGVSGTDKLVSHVGLGVFGPGMKAGAFVRDRFTTEVVGELPAPPNGWILPFKTFFSQVESNTLYVLDVGGFPAVGLYFAPIISKYTYTYESSTKTFTATFVSSLTLPQPANAPNPIGFCADPIELENGDILFPDQFWGALYLLKPDGTCEYVLGPQNSGLENGFDQLKSGLFPVDLADIWFNGSMRQPVHFKFAGASPTDGGFAPGLNYLSKTNTHLYFQSLNAQAFYRMPIAALYDNRQAWERISSVEIFWEIPTETDATAPGGPKLFAAHTFNQYNPLDTKLYVTDLARGAVSTLDTTLGSDQEMQILIQDTNLLDSAVSIAFLPPVLGKPIMVVANDQEFLLPGLNGYIPFDPTQPPAPVEFPVPFRLTKITL